MYHGSDYYWKFIALQLRYFFHVVLCSTYNNLRHSINYAPLNMCLSSNWNRDPSSGIQRIAYRKRISLGFCTEFQGVVMDNPNDFAYNKPDIWLMIGDNKSYWFTSGVANSSAIKMMWNTISYIERLLLVGVVKPCQIWFTSRHRRENKFSYMKQEWEKYDNTGNLYL
jgi:hypothetical protein